MLAPLLTGMMVALFGWLAAPVIADRLAGPTCQDPGGLIQQTALTASGTSKSAEFFPSKGRVSYEAGNLIDGNTSTAWVEDEPGLGIGAEATVTLPEPEDVRLICLVNGYGEAWDLYKKNSRARLLETRTDRGRSTSLLQDAGSSEHPAVYQEINFVAGRTSRITFIIRSAYAAQRPNATIQSFADTSISEVEVWTSR